MNNDTKIQSAEDEITIEKILYNCINVYKLSDDAKKLNAFSFNDMERNAKACVAVALKEMVSRITSLTGIDFIATDFTKMAEDIFTSLKSKSK